MSKKIVNVKFSHEDGGTGVKYYRTLPGYQLICFMDDSWYSTTDDGTWEEPGFPISEDKFDIRITEKKTCQEVCATFFDIAGLSVREARELFETISEEGRDELCGRLSDQQSEIEDITNVSWFMTKRNDLLGLYVT